MTFGNRKRKAMSTPSNPRWKAKFTIASTLGAETKVLKVIAITVTRKMKVCSLE
jgi:hypothetical protein